MAPKKTLADYAKELYVGGIALPYYSGPNADYLKMVEEWAGKPTTEEQTLGEYRNQTLADFAAPEKASLERKYYGTWPAVKELVQDYKQAAKLLAKVQPQVRTPDTRYYPPNPPSTIPTTVYRVENGQGQGPYSRQASRTIALEDALVNQCSIRCPEPYFDGKPEYKENPLLKSLEVAWSRGRYGFLDMDCLRKWFTPEEWRLLYESGYRIVAYATTDIQWLGASGQLAFNPGASRPLDTYPIDYYDTEAKPLEVTR